MSASASVTISDYLINVPKLKPRLAAIYDVEEDMLQCTWNRGQYQVKSDKEIFALDAVRSLVFVLCNRSNGYVETTKKLTFMIATDRIGSFSYLLPILL